MEEEHCHNVKITYLQEEKQFINWLHHTYQNIRVIIEILITYYSTINYDFTLTEALSFLLKLSLDIVTPFLQSVFFQSQQAMMLQRFFHCCNAEKKMVGLMGYSLTPLINNYLVLKTSHTQEMWNAEFITNYIFLLKSD